MGGCEGVTVFEEIYHQHFRDVYRFVLSLCRDKAVAEEITQETFYRALKSIDSFKGQCKIKVWLCQIAKNAYYTHLEKLKKLEPSQVPDRPSLDNTEEAVMRKEEVFRIHKSLHCLQEPYKEVFTLRVFGELSFGEIIELYGKTESWARVTYHRAKQKMHTLLKEEDSTI